jgi:hypothetical protein
VMRDLKKSLIRENSCNSWQKNSIASSPLVLRKGFSSPRIFTKVMQDLKNLLIRVNS